MNLDDKLVPNEHRYSKKTGKWGYWVIVDSCFMELYDIPIIDEDLEQLLASFGYKQTPMRNEKGQFIRGQSGNSSGRPKRADEQFLIDLWTDHGKEIFTQAVIDKKDWAVKLLVNKLYANKLSVRRSDHEETDHSLEAPQPQYEISQ